MSPPETMNGDMSQEDAYTQEEERMYRAYEAAKRQWIAANPAATPEEYEKAIRMLAKRYGI